MIDVQVRMLLATLRYVIDEALEGRLLLLRIQRPDSFIVAMAVAVAEKIFDAMDERVVVTFEIEVDVAVARFRQSGEALPFCDRQQQLVQVLAGRAAFHLQARLALNALESRFGNVGGSR